MHLSSNCLLQLYTYISSLFYIIYNGIAFSFSTYVHTTPSSLHRLHISPHNSCTVSMDHIRRPIHLCTMPLRHRLLHLLQCICRIQHHRPHMRLDHLALCTIQWHISVYPHTHKHLCAMQCSV